MLQDYLKKRADTTAQGDVREKHYCWHLSGFIELFEESISRKKSIFKVISPLTHNIEVHKKMYYRNYSDSSK
jgi:hypothetical protein